MYPQGARTWVPHTLVRARCALRSGHWMGCTWWFVADVELHASGQPFTPQNDWQPHAELLLPNSTLSSQFSRAFFWGAGIVTAILHHTRTKPDHT